MLGTHLCAQADAEKGLVLPQRHGEPVDLPADEIVGIIGAHRAAEDDRAGVIGKRRRQRIAGGGAAHVPNIAVLRQPLADRAGLRFRPVEDQ
jgi:hypothetical protein